VGATAACGRRDPGEVAGFSLLGWCLGFVVVWGSVVLGLQNGEGSMSVIRCEEFKVACAPNEESCAVCVLRIRAAEREEARARVEASRRVLLGRADGRDASNIS